MAYRVRPGIVLIKICDTHLLVAERKEWEHCPAVRPVSKIMAAVWRLMEEGKTDVEAIHVFASLLKRSDEDIRHRFQKGLDMLIENGFLVEE